MGLILTKIVDSCAGKIVSFLVDGVISCGANVTQYKNKVKLLKEGNERLREKKERIQGIVDREKNYGNDILTEVSSWLEEVKQMERENEEQMERDIANFLRQQENGEQMQQDFANFLRQKENGEQMERHFANFLRQQGNGEQMERDFTNFLENGESFTFVPGCMCPNLMWRHERGKEAEEKKKNVMELIIRGERLERSPVGRKAPYPDELRFDTPSYYTVFQSRFPVFAEIMKALEDPGVDIIGVHGPGGAGKTTMVKKVAKESKELGIFEKIAIAVVSKDPNPSNLQNDLVAQLDLEGEQSESTEAVLGNALLRGKRKILVVLDDLWQPLKLNELGIPISGLGKKGCKILLTSREEKVFDPMNVSSPFFIGYLKKEEAWELFKTVTGNIGVDELTARKVCEKCADLPIAIVVVGCALRGKDANKWRIALHKLEKSPYKYMEDELKGYTPLKLSYDLLEDKGAKSCFLLCCLFPEDAEISIDDLVRYSLALGFLGTEVNTLESATIEVQSMVDKLKGSCLLLNGAQENFVKMHDVIRNLAIFITKQQQAEHSGGQDWPRQQQFMVDHNFQKWPQNDAWKHHTAISLRINDKFSYPGGVLHCPLMHTLVLKSERYRLKIPNDFIQGRKTPRVLDFENISLDFRSLVFELNDLRMLRLKYCELLGELSTIGCLKNLKIFIFENIEIKKLPEEIGELTHLQVLDLRCNELEVIPKGVISKLSNLEELYVACEFMEWDTDTTVDGGEMSNASISELKSLDKLTSLHVKISAKGFKIMVEECLDLFRKLSKFFIFINEFWTLGPPNVLSIAGRDGTDEGLCPLIKKVDPLMEKVDRLMLTCIPDLRYLTRSGGGSFRKLTKLFIRQCHSMKYIFSPSCARELQQLQILHVFECKEMKQIIGVADNYHGEEVVTDEVIIFRQLRILHLQDLPRFRSFCPKIGENSSNWTTTAESIFNEKVFFPILEELTIWKFLKDIWKQVIQSPNGSNNVSFSQLKKVIIAGCKNLLQITSSGGGFFRQLTELYIGECHSMKYIFSPSHARELQQLQCLKVRDCREVERIIGVADNYHGEEVVTDEIIIFRQLRELELQGLPRCRSFCPKIEGNPSNWTTTAESIFNEKVSFPSLEILTIEELPVKHIWNKQVIQSLNRSNNVSFSQLKKVIIKKVIISEGENLVNVFPSNMIPQLQNLEYLLVYKCDSVTSVVEDLNFTSESLKLTSSYREVLPKLRYLNWNTA